MSKPTINQQITTIVKLLNEYNESIIGIEKTSLVRDQKYKDLVQDRDCLTEILAGLKCFRNTGYYGPIPAPTHSLFDTTGKAITPNSSDKIAS